MTILNEQLHAYVVRADKNEDETGQFITMTFFDRTADLRFNMSIELAKQLLESLKDALKDE